MKKKRGLLISLAILITVVIGICVGINKRNSNDSLVENYDLDFVLNESSDGYIVAGLGTCTDANIIIPSKYRNLPVNEIGKNAFYKCEKLTSVVIPNSITKIDYGAFYYCKSISSIIIPNSVIFMEKYAFDMHGSATIYCEASIQPSGWHSDWLYNTRPVYWGINSNNFLIKNEIIYVIIDNSAVVSGHTYKIPRLAKILPTIKINKTSYNVTSIGDRAFGECTSLFSVNIPDTVTRIGDYAFYDCEILPSIMIHDNVNYIGFNTFAGCYSLITYCEATSQPSEWNVYWNFRNMPVYWGINVDNYSIQKGIIYVIIDGNAVVTRYTNELESVVKIPLTININKRVYNVTKIGDYAFYDFFNNCSVMNSIEIPNSITHIGDSAFFGNSLLTSISISTSVKYIGAYAFCGCLSLPSIEIPNSITTFEYCLFQNCVSLSSIKIPTSVTSIDYSVFDSCISLSSIVIPSSVINMSYEIFRSCQSLTVYCEAITQPSGWDMSWNYDVDNVYWGREWSYVNGIPTPNV